MKKAWSALLVCALVFCQGGCTSMLWDDTRSDDMLYISADDITEQELQKRGVEYEIYSNGSCNGFLVEKSLKDKFKDYHLRLLGTPVTLTVDAATTVVVAGAMILYTNPEGTAVLLNDLCN